MLFRSSTPITFCMPAEKDEGICSLTLARFLGEVHNRFVERVDEALLLYGRDAQRASRQAVVSSKFFSNAHAVLYDMGSFVQFLEKQCVQYSSSGSVMYDFKAASQYLLNLFVGKPLLELQLPMVEYANNRGEGTMTMATLKQKVKQEQLSKDTIQTIVKELGSPSSARRCLELLETCVSFLQATGGTFIAQLDVGDRKSVV